MITHKTIETLFTYHAPNADQQARLQEVREKAKVLAHTMLAAAPPSADLTAAIRLLRESVMTCNASIVLEGKV